MSVTINLIEGNEVTIQRSVIGSVELVNTVPNSVTVSQVAVGSGDLHFEHTQSVASDQWDITHNLNKKPAVSVLDSNDYVVYAIVHHITNNRVIIEFNVPTFGKAVFN